MRLVNMILQDMKFQYRQGFYPVYFLVAIVYTVILRNMPMEYRSIFTAFVILTDTSMLGMFFVGAVLLMEREQGLMEGLFASPLKTGEYLSAKVISFSLLAVGVTYGIIFAGGVEIRSYLLLTGMILLNVFFFTLLGMGAGAKVKSVNGYMMTVSFYSMIFVVPFLKYIYDFDSIFMYLFPTKGMLLLMEGALYREMKVWEVIYSFGYYLAGMVLVRYWAEYRIEKYVVYKGEEA